MGGLIVLYFVLQHPDLVDGVIVSSPALGLAVKVPIVKRLLGNLMSKLLPSLTMSNGLDVSMLSHDKEVVRAYADDPLVHDRVSTRWFTEFLRAMHTVNSSAEELKTSILMQLAGNDHLTDMNAAKKFLERVKVKDKALDVYDGLYHEIYNEREELRMKPLGDLANWLRLRQ